MLLFTSTVLHHKRHCWCNYSYQTSFKPLNVNEKIYLLFSCFLCKSTHEFEIFDVIAQQMMDFIGYTDVFLPFLICFWLSVPDFNSRGKILSPLLLFYTLEMIMYPCITNIVLLWNHLFSSSLGNVENVWNNMTSIALKYTISFSSVSHLKKELTLGWTMMPIHTI